MNLLSEQGRAAPRSWGAVLGLFALSIGYTACSGVMRQDAASKKGQEGSRPQAREIAPSGNADSANFLTGKPSAEFDDGDLAVWYRATADDVLLTFRSKKAVILNVDVNQNGQADRGADLSYATFEDGRSCVQFLKPVEGPAECGDYPTAATVASRHAGVERYVAWRIPKRDLAPPGKAPEISLRVFVPEDQTSSFYPGQPFKLVFRLSPDVQSPGGALTTNSAPPALSQSPLGKTSPRPKPSAASPVLGPGRKPSQQRMVPPKVTQTSKPGPPRYNLLVYADSPIETGTQIKFGDARLRNLGFAVQYGGPQPPPNYNIRVEWWFEGVRYSPFNFLAGDVSYAAPHQYNNVIHDPGKFEVRLLIGGDLRQTLAFEVVK